MYSFDNQRYIFESKKLQFPPKIWFTMTLNKSRMANSKNRRSWVEAKLFLSGQFYVVCSRCKAHPRTWLFCHNPPKWLRIFLKGNFITYSNSPLALSLGVYLNEYLSCDREFLPFFFKHTLNADDIAGKYLYIHNLEVDHNLHSNTSTMKNSMPLLSLVNIHLP